MTALLATAGLTRRYGSLPAVDQVDLALPAGARHALIGPNGAGKSTLLDLIAGTVRPSAGRIRLRGRDITGRGPVVRARLGIARTFQVPAVIDSLTALENVVVGAWRHHRTGSRLPGRHRRALAGRGLDQLAALGLVRDARVRAGALSHGRRRLLDLAVALAADPAVLLLDEPGAGLGEADLPRLLAVLDRLPAGMAVLLVEHNQDLVTAFADAVTVLHRGAVLATGPPPQVRADPAVAEIYPATTAGR